MRLPELTTMKYRGIHKLYGKNIVILIIRKTNLSRFNNHL